MTLREHLKNNILLLDGGMGTLLQEKGLSKGELPENWNLSHPEVIKGIHKAYFDAGSNIVNANTFGANPFKFSSDELEEIVKAAISNAREAAEASDGKQDKFVALDIGPSGKLLEPFGELSFDDAVSAFKEVARLGEKYGADLVTVETMNDSYETKAALLAVKESCSLPVIVTCAFGSDGKLMTGASPEAMVAMLEGLGADAIGANCSLGPKQLSDVVDRFLQAASVPVVFKPNAGLPHLDGEKTVFDITSSEFAEEVALKVRKGVRIVGGCCGTTPEYIEKLRKELEGVSPLKISEKQDTVVSSYTHAVKFGGFPVLIGERINPTGKKRFKQALSDGDIDYILGEGIGQQERGVHILDVNVGLPGIDEPKMLLNVTKSLQAVSNLPLQIDTSDPVAMEAALRYYNGKAMINSVSGKEESMNAVFPLVKKYGGVVVALTLDEGGIPESAEDRVKIAKKILSCAEKYGVKKKDIVFDTLAMTVSADKNAAVSTLRALNIIKNELGCRTSLGVSNVSFGLPARDVINGTFFALALASGLDAAIMNPYSAEMMKTYYSYRALSGLDESCMDYISFAETLSAAPLSAKPDAATSNMSETAGDNGSLSRTGREGGKETDGLAKSLSYAIEKGMKEKAGELCRLLLQSEQPLELVKNEIIPALDKVGIAFEQKKLYLPQLLMSAEAAKAAFEQIKLSVKSSGGGSDGAAVKPKFVLATVKGDIHDIGKNIVRLLLENYGYDVIDLGKDVAPETVLDAVLSSGAPFVGLSALMTTTVPSMEETIKLIRSKAPDRKIIVGGAVLTKDYADSIGADYYSSDAMETVRICEGLLNRENS